MLFVLAYAASIILAYLLGALPVGFLVVRIFSGKDIRQFGSGRTGGTNAMRAAGALAGILTGLGDVAKGFGAVYIARLFFPQDPLLPLMEALCGVAAVAGHNWSIYLGFRGGAGTGPNAGVATALWPYSALILLPLIPIVLIVTGYASVASTLAAIAIVAIFVVRTLIFHYPVAHVGYAVATTILVALALIPNYRRLIAGTERLVGPRAKAMAQRGE